LSLISWLIRRRRQATALAFGGFHTAALLVEVDETGYRDHLHSLYTWGRGELG
jgi:hypothetical protein